jgi:hypothetical protein
MVIVPEHTAGNNEDGGMEGSQTPHTLGIFQLAFSLSLGGI